jgi:hypothetical protein
MRRLMGLVWLLCGAGAITIGIVNAAGVLRGLYDTLGEDALADSRAEAETPRRMLVALAWGAGGVIPLGIGTVMLRRARRPVRGKS